MVPVNLGRTQTRRLMTFNNPNISKKLTLVVGETGKVLERIVTQVTQQAAALVVAEDSWDEV
jgi:hypothetical protein